MSWRARWLGFDGGTGPPDCVARLIGVAVAMIDYSGQMHQSGAVFSRWMEIETVIR